MENENVFDAPASDQNNPLTLSPQASGYLNEARKWSKFLAIVGFCMVGLAIIAGLFAGTLFSMMGQHEDMPFPAYFIGVIYAAMGLIYFFPLYYLFKFSTHVKTALANRNSQELESAFENLKSHYKYVGIMVIIAFAFYLFFGGGMLLITAMKAGS